MLRNGENLIEKSMEQEMSERVEKLIAQENAEILRMLHDDEAFYVRAYFYVDNNGKRVYDMDLIKQEFEENIETLISLNKQRGRSDGKIA